MITFEQMLEVVEEPVFASLDVSAFSEDDVVNIILQRSEIIRDQRRPGRVVAAWSEGDSAPALALVAQLGDTLIRRAAAMIWLEFQEILPTLRTLAPRSASDIGCGYAFFDYFLWREFGCDLTLIDLEQSEERHFGYKERGAAYSNLMTARRFLISNGVDEHAIHLRNPSTDNLFSDSPVDLAVSFISCGFHYPVDTYLDYFRRQVSPTGGVIVDFRARKAREGAEKLRALGQVSVLTDAAYGNAKRTFLQKG